MVTGIAFVFLRESQAKWTVYVISGVTGETRFYISRHRGDPSPARATSSCTQRAPRVHGENALLGLAGGPGFACIPQKYLLPFPSVRPGDPRVMNCLGRSSHTSVFPLKP